MHSSLIVWSKEILDTRRDSRTVFLTLALPLVLYPVIFIVVGRVHAANVAHEGQAVLQVAVRGLQHAPALEDPLHGHEQLRVFAVTLGPESLSEGLVHAFVDVPANHEALVLSGAPSTIRIYYDATSALSRLARRQVGEALDAYKLQVLRSKLEALGGDRAIVDAARYETENLATAGQMGALALSALVPYLLVLLIASGAAHIAVDTTAGEKERSTLETVLVSAASRRQIILGKFLAVFTTSVMSGIMGFVGLMVAMSAPASALVEAGSEISLELDSVLVLLAMILPVAALLSATFLALGCFARGSREGQTFASYFIFFVIMLAVLSTLIEIDLTTEIFLIPILGTTLAQRQLLTGSGDALQVMVAVGSTLAVAAAALWVAVQLFANERVMFRQ